MDNFKNFFTKLNFKKNGRLFGIGTSPDADWKIIFVSTIMLAILVIGLSTFIFIKVGRGEIFVVEKPTEEGEHNLNLPLLRETVSYYQDKLVEFEKIKNTKTPAVDPSL